MKARAVVNSRQSEAVKAAWAERKGYVASLEERCRNLEAALQEEKERSHAFQEAYQGQINWQENQRESWDSQERIIRQRTKVAQQYFDVARNLGLKPGGEQAEPWLLQREER